MRGDGVRLKALPCTLVALATALGAVAPREPGAWVAVGRRHPPLSKTNTYKKNISKHKICQ